ncbi:MAG: DUF2059 domain-containing protein [Pseudomonadota bacterium]|nr:DUF2059 domain-containing protein [Pseudomonadota bacterium]
MKILFASLSIALATSTLASAAPAGAPPVETAGDRSVISPRSLELARQFVAIARPAGDRLDWLEGFASMAASEGSEQAEDEAAEQRTEKIMARFEPTLQKLMPALMDAYAYAYAREFSDQELEQLIAFAQSPVGKHYVTSVASVESNDAVIGLHETIGEELEPIMRDVAKEVCTKKAAERLAAGDTKAKCPLSEGPETASS